jgi:DNA polymerase
MPATRDTGRAAIDGLRRQAANCRACDLWKTGTQTVFGDGPPTARIVLVGEQPGNEEDLAGLPFVGPAGRLLDRALAEASIDRRRVYVTNAVKHFKWVPQGKRRIHKKPSGREIRACKAWLDGEIEALDPELVVCLGATAAQALLGADFRVTQMRGKILTHEGRRFLATVHPSSILRAQDEDARRLEFQRLVADLRMVHELLPARSR